MKIAFVLTTFPEISQTFILHQITSLLDMGHTVDIFAERDPRRARQHPDMAAYGLLDHTVFTDHAYCAGNLLHVLRKHPPRSLADIGHTLNPLAHGWRNVVSLRAFCIAWALWKRRGDYDIIHCHFGTSGQRSMLLRSLGARGRLMVTFHGYDANLHPRYAFRKKYRRLFQQADLCTANSHYTRAKVIELGCDPAKIRVLPMGIRLDRFPFAARRLPAGETLHVLTVARLVEKKGIAYGICAVALLARTCAVRYTIVGEGPQRKLLHALVGALGMHEQIVLVGQQDEHAVRAYYAQAHVFMLPSVSARDGDEEGQGVVLQEAQAMGLPVVATHHNGFPESVLDGVSGVLVPERNVEALAEALRQLREQESAWPQMGAAGRQFVSERFDMQLLAQQLVELYTELCQ